MNASPLDGNDWMEFNGPADNLPPERKLVMVIVKEEPDKGLSPTLAVGYLRYAAGDKDSPFFVIPGRGGQVSHWLDCLAVRAGYTPATAILATGRRTPTADR